MVSLKHAHSPAAAESRINSVERLYVSPLNVSLLSTVLHSVPLRISPKISYHSIETFPEKAFSYLDLPAEEAQKLKKKLNGCILRGIKMRVEDARPEKRRRDTDVADSEVSSKKTKKEQRQSRKKPKDDGHVEGVLPAVTLPADRHVKRGWTQSSSKDKTVDGENKKRKTMDEHGGAGEMIFRTNLPLNIASETAFTEGGSKLKKRGRNGKTRKTVEVKEFSKTTKFPTFLRSNQAEVKASRAAEFIDGKGWVDNNGNVVEVPNTDRRTRLQGEPTNKEDSRTPNSNKQEKADEGVGSHGSQSLKSPQESTSSPSSNEEEDSSDVASQPELTRLKESPQKNEIHDTEIIPKQPVTFSDAPPSPDRPVQYSTIHPLEAMFKRPASKPEAVVAKTGKSAISHVRPAPIQTSFTFFDHDNDFNSLDHSGAQGDNSVHAMDSAESSMRLKIPQTPFTQRDMESRGIRSAAPTPDTAAVGKRFSLPWRGESIQEALAEEADNEGDDRRGNSASRHKSAHAGHLDHVSGVGEVESQGAEEAQSAFEKRFWEQRGDNNRNWKARLREVKKGKRQSANRTSGGQRVHPSI